MEYRFLAGTPIVDTDRKTWERYFSTVAIIVVSVAIFALYFSTLAPTITWRNGGADSGELAAAVAEMGIAHPPGYPAYVLIGHLWSMLPLGADIAYRLNLLSAVSAMIAGLVIMRLIFQLSPERVTDNFTRTIGAIFGGTVLMLAPLVWSQATITEVYAPGLMLVALVAWVLLRKRQPSTVDYGAAGLMTGVGMGVLPQIILFLPGMILLPLFHWQSIPKNRLQLRTVGRRWLVMLMGFTGGLLVFLWLPLRAAMHPVANWGNPITASRFWILVSAQQYHHLILQPTFSEWLFRLGQSLSVLVQQLSWAGILFAVFGGIRLWREMRAAAIFLLVLLAGTLLFRSGYPVAGNAVYLLPVLFLLAVFAGYGLMEGLAEAQQHIGTAAQVIGILLLASLIWRGLVVYPMVNVHSDWQAYQFGQQILTGLPPDAVVVTDRDETTFSLWYLQSQGVRSDVTVIDNRLLYYDWYRQNLMVHTPSLQTAMLQPDVLDIPGRPIFLLSTPVEFSVDSFTYLLK